MRTRTGPSLHMRRWIALLCLLTWPLLAGCDRGKGSRTPDHPGNAATAPYDGPQPELVVQAGSNHLVMSTAFAPDGGRFVTASGDGLVKLWDPSLGRQIKNYTGANGPLYDVEFSPDGRLIAAGGLEKALYLWDVHSGELRHRLTGHGNWVWTVAFSPDGRRVATGSADVTVAIWEVDSGAPVQVLTHSAGVRALTYSPDGRYIATVSDRLTLWDSETGRRIGTVEFDDFGLNPGGLFFSADGSRLSVGLGDSGGADENIRPAEDGEKGGKTSGKASTQKRTRRTIILDTSTWTPVAEIPDAWPLGVDGPRQELLLRRPSDTQRVDFATGQQRRSLPEGGAFGGRSAALSPDGSLVVAATGMSFDIHDAKSGAVLRHVQSLFGAAVGEWVGNAVQLMQTAWSPTEPLLAVGGFDGHVRVIDLRRGAAPTVDEGVGFVEHLKFSPNGAMLLAAGPRALVIYEARSMQRLLELDRPEGAPGWASFAFRADGQRLLLGTSDGSIVEFALPSGERLRASEPITPDADCRSADAGSVFGRSAPVTGLSYGPDGKYVYGIWGATSTIVRFDASDLSPTGGGCVHVNTVNATASDPSGRYLASAGGEHMLAALAGEKSYSNNAVVLSDLGADGKFLRQLDGATLATLDVAFDRRGKRVAGGSADGIARVWDVGSGELLHTLAGHDAEISAVSFSHDDRYLVTASYDLSVKIWDLGKGGAEAATLVTLGKEGFVMHTPEHYYTASREGFDYVAFRLGDEVVPVELFDLRLNRPDLVLARLGYAPPSLIELYRRAYQKRLRKVGVDEAALSPDYRLPEVRVDRSAVPLATSEPQIRFQVSAEDPVAQLDRLLVFVNDVPVHGMNGLPLEGRPRQVTLPVELALGPGRNKVQVSVLNERGVESLKQTFEVVSRRAHPKPDLYVLAIGVSKHENSSIDLKYAAKDAHDFAALARKQRERYGKVKVVELVDEAVTREQVLEARKLLAASKVEDEVVVFVAGHGVLDDQLDYYFVTHDFRIDAPAARGLTYQELESVIDGIPARQKLMLVDTCHSGEVDEDAQFVAPPPAGAGTPSGAKVTVSTQARGLELNASVSTDDTHELLAQLFADLRRGTGAMVISSASGSEFALESPQWNNGVFTYAVLSGLASGSADADGDGRTRVSELRDYVVREVRALTGGQQTPTARRENLEFDFEVF